MTFFQEKCMTNSKKRTIVQLRLNERDQAKFNEIKEILEFDRQQGVNRTPRHFYAENERITDSDVLRYIIRNFQFKD
jgi:hypothetical protein